MRIISTIALAFMGAGVAAQCDFDVLISPQEIDLLCPGEEVTLTTGIFDSYQWYMDGEPIEGATSPSLTVTWDDSGAPYTVEVTLDGCTELSDLVWVDGHNWTFPWVAHGGDQPVELGPDGEPFMCEGQILELEMNPAFVVVNWLESGAPIPDANENILVVTENGNYGAIAHPAVCPNLVHELDLVIPVVFLEALQPEITDDDGQLCASPEGLAYNWYFNGELLVGQVDPCITVEGAGAYTVFVDYGSSCQDLSEPYIIMGVDTPEASPAAIIHPNPTTGILFIAMAEDNSAGARYQVLDVVGRQVAAGSVSTNGILQLDLGHLGEGTYLFQTSRDGRTLAPASRFTIVK